ncbi:MAG: cytochrome c biogenesis protein [Saprospiraceae bacterium]|nr:cytochrome c biogenesis protein [Saprospiraceae bacterium]
MVKHWWKALGVVLIIYTFTVGMLVPLKPGITTVTPSSVRTGEEIKLEVSGYNSNFKKSQDSLRAWLKLNDEQALAAKNITVKNEQQLQVVFDIPSYLPVGKRVQDFTLIVDNDHDGASLLPNAVFVTQDSIDPEMGQKVWKNAVINDLNDQRGITFPFRNILGETIRNTYFHVALWLAMVAIFVISVTNSVKYLRNPQPIFDYKAQAYTRTGLLLGLLGIITGAIWAKNTWGAYWSGDIKQNMTAIALLIYLAYFILRASLVDNEQKARVAAVYNIFAFVALIPLIYVIPRLNDSLHPGAGGNISFGSQDLDNTMRMVFYPAIIGWFLIGMWMATLQYRMDMAYAKIWNLEDEDA